MAGPRESAQIGFLGTWGVEMSGVAGSASFVVLFIISRVGSCGSDRFRS